MLVCRVELWPFGNYKKAQVLGAFKLINDGTGTEARGNYDCQLLASDATSIIRSVRVEGHARKTGWLALVNKAVAALAARKGGGNRV